MGPEAQSRRAALLRAGRPRQAPQALAFGVDLRSRVEALEAVGDGGELDGQALAFSGQRDNGALASRGEPAHERRQHGAQQLTDEDNAEDLEVERRVSLQAGDRRDPHHGADDGQADRRAGDPGDTRRIVRPQARPDEGRVRGLQREDGDDGP